MGPPSRLSVSHLVVTMLAPKYAHNVYYFSRYLQLLNSVFYHSGRFGGIIGNILKWFTNVFSTVSYSPESILLGPSRWGENSLVEGLHTTSRKSIGVITHSQPNLCTLKMPGKASPPSAPSAHPAFDYPQDSRCRTWW